VKGRIAEAVRAAPTKTHTIVLDAEAMTHVDTAGFDALDSLAATLERDGITIVYARLRPHLSDRLEPGYPTVRSAVSAAAS
jgi:anti-anti-sigma regulatory factor